MDEWFKGSGAHGFSGLGARRLWCLGFRGVGVPKGPCTQIVYTLAPKYLYRDYFKAKVYLFGYMDP